MRQRKPWYHSSNNSWYVQHNGKQCPLGLHPEDAPPLKKSKTGWNAPASIMDAFYKLMASDLATMPKAQDIRAAQVCDLFLE